MLLETTSSQLVLVDLQTRMMPALHGSADMLANVLRLARAAQLLRVPLTVVEQNPQGLGPSVPELQEFIRASGRPVMAKQHFNACAEGLGDVLAQLGTPKASPNAKSVPKHLQKPQGNQREQIVLAGCEAHVCLLQTAMGLLDEFDVFVVTDACSSRTERNRDAAYDRLAAEGASLVSTEMVLFEWVGRSDGPGFGEVLEWVKT